MYVVNDSKLTIKPSLLHTSYHEDCAVSSGTAQLKKPENITYESKEKCLILYVMLLWVKIYNSLFCSPHSTPSFRAAWVKLTVSSLPVNIICFFMARWWLVNLTPHYISIMLGWDKMNNTQFILIHTWPNFQLNYTRPLQKTRILSLSV